MGSSKIAPLPQRSDVSERLVLEMREENLKKKEVLRECKTGEEGKVRRGVWGKEKCQTG